MCICCAARQLVEFEVRTCCSRLITQVAENQFKIYVKKNRANYAAQRSFISRLLRAAVSLQSIVMRDDRSASLSCSETTEPRNVK